MRTRAKALGIQSPALLVANTKRRVAKIKALLDTLAAPYAEVDNSVQDALRDLQRQFDEFVERLDGTLEFLNEEVDW